MVERRGLTRAHGNDDDASLDQLSKKVKDLKYITVQIGEETRRQTDELKVCSSFDETSSRSLIQDVRL